MPPGAGRMSGSVASERGREGAGDGRGVPAAAQGSVWMMGGVAMRVEREDVR